MPSSINNPPDNKVNMWLGATAGMRILRYINEALELKKDEKGEEREESRRETEGRIEGRRLYLYHT